MFELMNTPSSPVTTEMGFVVGPFPTAVRAERNTTYEVWGRRESIVIEVELEKYCSVSPFSSRVMLME